MSPSSGSTEYPRLYKTKRHKMSFKKSNHTLIVQYECSLPALTYATIDLYGLYAHIYTSLNLQRKDSYVNLLTF